MSAIDRNVPERSIRSSHPVQLADTLGAVVQKAQYTGDRERMKNE
jgi:hypothetical protein